MNPKARRCIFFLSFLLFSTVSFSQNVFIANDFVACGVGLKDSSGKWLTEPIYQRIQYSGNGYYEMLLGSKEGILDSTGKVVIPAIYDYVNINFRYIDSASVIFVVVVNNEYAGVVNIANRVIVPVTCRSVDISRDGIIIARKTKRKYSLYTIKGEERSIPGKFSEAPEPLDDHLYKVSKNGFAISLQRKYNGYHRRRGLIRKMRALLSYRIKIKHKYGMMNDSFQLIIPKKFSEIRYSPGKYKLINVTKHKKSGYYNTEGKEIWAPVFEEDYTSKYGYSDFDFVDKRIPLINDIGYTKAKLGRKYGLIGVSGDTLLPFIYTSLSIHSRGDERSPNTTWSVSNGYKQGIYDPVAGTWILPLEFNYLNDVATYYFPKDSTLKISGSNEIYRVQSRSIAMKLFVAKRNGKYGMLTSTGQEILPFIYDNYEVEQDVYFFRNGESYISVAKPMYKDTLTRYTPYLSRVVLDCPKNLQFEKVQKENGVILFVNKDLIADSAQLKLYGMQNSSLIVNKETYENILHATAIVIKPLPQSKNFPGIGPVFDYKTVNLNYQKEEEIKMFSIDTAVKRKIRPVYVIDQDSFHSYYRAAGSMEIFREDGSLLMPPNSYNSCLVFGEFNGLKIFRIDCGRNKIGLIDGNGKLLIDTTWGELRGLTGNHIWVKQKKHRFFDHRHYYDWNIMDTTTHKLLLPKKGGSSRTAKFGENAALIQRPGGEKLFNMNTQKYIAPTSTDQIFKLDSAGKFYAVRTCFGHIGIVDGNGKWLVDTVWTTLINATNKDNLFSKSTYKSYYYNQETTGYRGSYPYNFCVLSNDTSWIIFNSSNGTATQDAASAHDLLNRSKDAFIDKDREGIRKFCADCPSYSYTDSTSSVPLAPWQEELLFDSLFTGETFIADSLYTWFAYRCADCRAKNPKQSFQYTWSKNYDREMMNHKIDFINDSCISVSRQNMSYSRTAKDLFFTVMLFNDGPHGMFLDSLFTGSEWKTIIANEVTLYFESHPNIQGNCHNPSMLPLILNDRFVITPNGIEFYPPNYKERNRQLHLLVSWEKLKPHLRDDVAQKLNLK